jgi:hypothetical protein
LHHRVVLEKIIQGILVYGNLGFFKGGETVVSSI